MIFSVIRFSIFAFFICGAITNSWAVGHKEGEVYNEDHDPYMSKVAFSVKRLWLRPDGKQCFIQFTSSISDQQTCTHFISRNGKLIFIMTSLPYSLNGHGPAVISSTFAVQSLVPEGKSDGFNVYGELPVSDWHVSIDLQ